MDFERELRELAQTDLEHIQDIQWHDLRRAVVTHLDSLADADTLMYPRIPSRQVCHHVMNQKPCPKWTIGTPCGAIWHPEFLQILEDGQPTWIWMPHQAICRTNQRSLGFRHQQGQLSCTDPNCIRAHAPNWLYSELWAFRWWVTHEFETGLATGYTLNGDLISISARTANLTLATMPYVDENYYHRFRWHAPIPQPEAYGDMIVTATSRRSNLNEQPRKGRATTPRRHVSPRRHVTPPRPLELKPKLHHSQLHILCRNHQSPLQWHLPSIHLDNIGSSHHQSTEPLRLFARRPVPQYTAFPPVCLHHLQLRAQWPYYTFTTKNSRHHPGSMVWEATDTIHPPEATDTHSWPAVPLARRQQLPTEQPTSNRVHILSPEPLPCESRNMGNNHTGQHDSTDTRPSTFRSPSVDTHGVRNTHSRCLSTQVLVAPTHCSPGIWHKNVSLTVVRGPPSYPNIYKPSFWRPLTSWSWPGQWDHPTNFDNQKALPWPPSLRPCWILSKAQWRWTWRWASQQETSVSSSWTAITRTVVWFSTERSTLPNPHNQLRVQRVHSP